MLSGVAMRARVNLRWWFVSACAAAACNTYDGGLLMSVDPTQPAGGAGMPAGELGGSAGSAGSPASAAGSGVSAGGGGASSAGGEAGTPSVAEAGSGNESVAGSYSGGGSSIGGSATGGVSSAEGGSSAGRGGSAGTAGAAAGGPSIAPNVLDDFEDGDRFVALVSGRNGPWYLIKDATAAGTVDPLAIVPFGTTDARAGSTSLRGLHLTAKGFTDWGVGVGADMVNQGGAKAVYDVSAYSGVHFYAKIATGTSALLKVLIPTLYSDADGLQCVGAQCGDHFYCKVTGLKTTWAEFSCTFASLVQVGFGLKQTKFDPKSVYSVQFAIPAVNPVDLWLDDVTFIPK